MTGKEGEITPEVAKSDIEKVMELWGRLGPGSELDGAAQLVLQTMQVVRNRLDKPQVIKLLYLDNPEASKLLPGIVLNTVQRLSGGSLTPDEARGIIDNAIPEYLEAFKSLGVTPQPSWVLYSKRDK